MKAFCLIVEGRSFSKAADAVFLTQSAMSHLVKSLEDEFDVKLLHRRGREVHPTPAGQLLYRHARQLLDQYKKMGEDMDDLIGRVQGPLSIGVTATAAAYLLPQVFYDFSKQYAGVVLQVKVEGSEKILSDLREGRIEVGVVEGNATDFPFYSIRIAEDEIVPIVPDDHPLAVRESVSAGDLASCFLILPEAGSAAQEFLYDFFRKSGIQPEEIKVKMTAGSPELIIQMVQSGIGISFLSKWSVFRAVKEGTIKVLQISGTKLVRDFCMLSLEEAPVTAAARAFAAFVRGYRFFMPF